MTHANYNINVSIDAQKVADLLTTALEGGSNYWIKILDMKGDTLHDTIKVANGESKWLLLEVDETDRWNGINVSSMTRGLSLLAEHAPERFARVAQDEADAEDADVFLQYALLGEVIYG